jgi:hypothetical protein
VFNPNAEEYSYVPGAEEPVYYDDPGTQEAEMDVEPEFFDEEEIDPERTRIAVPYAFQIYSEQTGLPNFFIEQRFRAFVGTDAVDHERDGVTLNDFWIIMYNAYQHEASEFPSLSAYSGPNPNK